MQLFSSLMVIVLLWPAVHVEAQNFSAPTNGPDGGYGASFDMH